MSVLTKKREEYHFLTVDGRRLADLAFCQHLGSGTVLPLLVFCRPQLAQLFRLQ